ncbi:nucleotidyltransferase domain-containing protein [Peribacillus frigoritolerans]|uniref:nucleotidyltransferase domain-containing protein n=1 Tax=Peribacillus frigoritolerans TaxID=450367 RepID=UPI002079B9B4|nr:nucleotidyltransferase family protein [Peribacillus frigoritolerans]USK73549.1 nucleotidyltransferase family protein [Peribacillus frigoritolerans]
MKTKHSLDLSLFSNEIKLLLEIMKVEDEKSFDNVLIKDINWNYFLQLAMYHRVYPLVYYTLSRSDEKTIPKYVIQTLKQEYKKNTFQMLHLSREMELLSQLFTDKKIPILFLKGPIIAADLYGDISLRTSKDLDILIPITKLEYAEELLLNFGYKREDETSLLNELKWRGHHITYIHTQKNIQLEIHWRLHPLPSKEPCFNELWEQRRVSKTSYPINFLGEEHLFLYLVSHGARHGWFRLRWLKDIDQMLSKGFNIINANILIKTYQSQHMVGQALILVSELLKTPLNEDMMVLTKGSQPKKLADSALYFIKEMEPLHILASTYKFRRYLFLLKPSIVQKVIHFILLFYPSSSDVKTMRLPKSLSFLYFPLRPFLSIYRKLRKTP